MANFYQEEEIPLRKIRSPIQFKKTIITSPPT